MVGMPGPESFAFFLFFLSFLVPVGIVVLIAMLVRNTTRRPTTTAPSTPGRPPALDVLEERYARGEITREEFAERRGVLLGEAPAPQAPSHPQPAPSAPITLPEPPPPAPSP